MKKLCVDVTDELFDRLQDVVTHFGHKTHIMREALEKKVELLEAEIKLGKASKKNGKRVKLPTEVYEE